MMVYNLGRKNTVNSLLSKSTPNRMTRMALRDSAPAPDAPISGIAPKTMAEVVIKGGLIKNFVSNDFEREINMLGTLLGLIKARL